MATIPLQICNGTDKCCKSFIILYSLFSLLSLHFFFSLISHSLVPSLFSLYWFPLSDQSGMFTINDDGVAPTTTARSATLDLTPTTRSHSSHSISPTLQPLDLADLTQRLPSISCSATLQPLCLSLVVGFFFFSAIWVDLMVVVGCGLWAMIVAVVVGCGSDGLLLSV